MRELTRAAISRLFSRPSGAGAISSVESRDSSPLTHTLIHFRISTLICRGSSNLIIPAMSQADSADIETNARVLKLIQCVKSGSLLDLQSLVKGNADLHIIDDNGSPLIHHAVVNPNTDVLEYFLNAGVSVEARDNQGRTPLLVLAREGPLKAIQVLVAHGANIHARDGQGSTALHYSTLQENSEDMISYFASKGVNIDVKNESDETAFHCCALVGNLPGMMSLVRRGANFRAQMVGGESSLHLAVRHPTPRVIEYLLFLGMDINAQDDEGITPLHVCALDGEAECVEFLLDKGASIDTRSDNGYTPLIYCAEGGSLQNLRVLVEKGASVQAGDKERKTAIHCAVSNANAAAIVEFLLKQGLSIESRDGLDRTPLHYFAQHGTLSSVEMLIEKGADINARAIRAATALHFAAANQRTTEIMELFLGKGMSIEERDDKGHTVLHHAIRFANIGNVKFLVEKGADVNAIAQDKVTSLHLAAAHGTIETLEYLLVKGMPIDVKDIRGATPLMVCAIQGDLQKMKFLVDSGADVFIQDMHGLSALHLAAANKNTTDIMQYLLDLGIPLEVKNKFGLSPLLYAAMRGNLKDVEFLCDRGAEVKTVDAVKRTALHYAARNFEGGPIITHLLAKGMSVNVRDDLGASPLLFSKVFDVAENKRILLENGATSESPSHEDYMTITMFFEWIE